MTVAPRSTAQSAASLPRTILFTLTAASVVACDDGRTYYPIKDCLNSRCEVLAHGKPYKRVADALAPERYAAVPERQEVMITTGTGAGAITFSLVKDYSFDCRVADQRNWQCVGPDEPDSLPAAYFMADGELSHRESSRLGAKDEDLIEYATWCDWQQVSWHNETSDKDDPPGPRQPVLPLLLAGVVYWVTGCWL
jgi:hypothetical protein